MERRRDARASHVHGAASRERAGARPARRRQHVGEGRRAQSARSRIRCTLHQRLGLGSRDDRAGGAPRGAPRAAARLAEAREALRRGDGRRAALALLDPGAPTPSVETLLHAFLPAKFIDHTHADAILALADQPDGEALCRQVFGAGLVWVPYVMPGFTLAPRVADAFEAARKGRVGDRARAARHLHVRRDREGELRADDRRRHARRARDRGQAAHRDDARRGHRARDRVAHPPAHSRRARARQRRAARAWADSARARDRRGPRVLGSQPRRGARRDRLLDAGSRASHQARGALRSRSGLSSLEGLGRRIEGLVRSTARTTTRTSTRCARRRT